MARNVTITRVNGANDQSSNGIFTGGVFTPSADNAVADIDRIETDINSGPGVTIAINTSGGGGVVQAGDITISGATGPDKTITKTTPGAATLRLNAENDIVVNAGTTIQQTTSLAPGDLLNIVLNADSDATGAGKIALAGTTGNLVTFTTNGGNISLGGRDITLAGAVGGVATYATGTDSTVANSTGVQVDFSTLNSGGGAIAIAGHGFAGGGVGNNRGVLLWARRT